MGNIIKNGGNAYLNEQMDDCIAKSTEASEKVTELTSDVASFRSQMEAMSTSPEENELTNIRAGYDGVTYTTAGEAVRANDQALDEKIDELKSDLSEFSLEGTQLFDRKRLSSGYWSTAAFSNDNYVYTEEINISNHHGQTIYFSNNGEPVKARYVAVKGTYYKSDWLKENVYEYEVGSSSSEENIIRITYDKNYKNFQAEYNKITDTNNGNRSIKENSLPTKIITAGNLIENNIIETVRTLIGYNLYIPATAIEYETLSFTGLSIYELEIPNSKILILGDNIRTKKSVEYNIITFVDKDGNILSKVSSENGYITKDEGTIIVVPENTEHIYIEGGKTIYTTSIISKNEMIEYVNNTVNHINVFNHPITESTNLLSNDTLEIDMPFHDFGGYTISVSALISNFNKITFGKNGTYFGKVEVNNSNVNVFSYGKSTTSFEHGLSIQDYIAISVKTNDNNWTANITISTNGGSYTIDNVDWYCRTGNLYVTSDEITNLTNVNISIFNPHWKDDIWLFGDSYFDHSYSKRWVYYLFINGYSNEKLFNSYPGRGSMEAYECFKNNLNFGYKPKCAIWCMGMNDSDSSSAINSNYKTYTDKFILDCIENDIVPILSTIPNCPNRNNYYKNEYVKSLPYRYIDFAEAVGATSVGSNWYNGMLYSDGVHPNESGAIALYHRAIIDVPELCC